MASSILTEAIKNAFKESRRQVSSNLIALVNAIVIGCGGTAIIYYLNEIPFNSVNVMCLALVALCVWISEMVGYDKVIQLIAQIKDSKGLK